MRHVETSLGMGGRGTKENDGRGEFKYDIFDIRTFIRTFATMHPPSTIKKPKTQNKKPMKQTRDLK
jgi:hypothetical protein